VELQIAGVVSACAIGLYLLRKSIGEVSQHKLQGRESFEEQPAKIGAILKQTPHFLVIILLAMTDAQISIYIISVLIGPKSVGIYQAALQPLNIILMGLVAAGVSIQPRLAAAWSLQQKSTAQELVSRATRFSSAIALGVGVPLILSAKVILHLYGPSFQGADILLIILTGAQIVRGLTGPIGVTLMMTGNQRRLFYFDSIFLLIKIAAIIVGIHYFGLIGAAIGEAMYWVTERVVGVAFTYKLTGLMTIMWRHPRES